MAKFTPRMTSCFEPESGGCRIFPAGRTLPVSHFHSDYLAPALPINVDGYKHRSRADHADSMFRCFRTRLCTKNKRPDSHR
jgi:hypothetical protein